MDVHCLQQLSVSLSTDLTPSASPLPLPPDGKHALGYSCLPRVNGEAGVEEKALEEQNIEDPMSDDDEVASIFSEINFDGL